MEKLVSLVWVKANIAFNQRLHIGNYDHPSVEEIIPCKEVQGRFYDLRTGKKVTKTADQIWPVLTGTVFCYPDGAEFLLSRRFSDNALLWLPIRHEDFHPQTMVRHRVREYVPPKKKLWWQ